MPIEESRLKQTIIDAINLCQQITERPDEAKDILAGAIAKAVVVELKSAKIIYNGGLTAPNGPVTGIFEGQLE